MYSQLSFDEWVQFVFDHPAAKEAWFKTPLGAVWITSQYERNSPQVIIDYATQLYENPGFLLVRYSPEQINQGLQLIEGPATSRDVEQIVRDKNLPLESRQRCVRAMVNLFRTVFAVLPSQSSCLMWWDSPLTYFVDPDLADTLLAAMAEILQLPSQDCQISALHGLGHMDHPKRKEIIAAYLEKNPDLEGKVREYALAAMEGKVL